MLPFPIFDQCLLPFPMRIFGRWIILCVFMVESMQRTPWNLARSRRHRRYLTICWACWAYVRARDHPSGRGSQSRRAREPADAGVPTLSLPTLSRALPRAGWTPRRLLQVLPAQRAGLPKVAEPIAKALLGRGAVRRGLPAGPLGIRMLGWGDASTSSVFSSQWAEPAHDQQTPAAMLLRLLRLVLSASWILPMGNYPFSNSYGYFCG